MPRAYWKLVRREGYAPFYLYVEPTGHGWAYVVSLLSSGVVDTDPCDVYHAIRSCQFFGSGGVAGDEMRESEVAGIRVDGRTVPRHLRALYRGEVTESAHLEAHRAACRTCRDS